MYNINDIKCIVQFVSNVVSSYFRGQNSVGTFMIIYTFKADRTEHRRGAWALLFLVPCIPLLFGL